jgi:hypothetical protein
MNQKALGIGGMTIGTMAIVFGIIIFPIGIELTMSYPVAGWWLGLVLGGSSGLLIYGGILSIRRARKIIGLKKDE